MTNLNVAFRVCDRGTPEVKRANFATRPHNQVGGEKFNEVDFSFFPILFISRVRFFLPLLFFLFPGALFPPCLLFANFCLGSYTEDLDRAVMGLNREVLQEGMKRELRNAMF